MSENNTPKILVFSDDSTFRSQVIAALGPNPWAGSETYEFLEAATSPGVMNHFDAEEDIKLCIFDGEVQKDGAMSVGHLLAGTYAELPPLLFVVARQQDEWLARGAGATKTLLKPINAAALTEAVRQILG
ncbi:hypothetical protein BSR29_08285 [Boudabousia liubingyangii]|uniref:Response regulatory domain-containing protein n=1 Tax=Boudabousia liubingyangii TaxID=1921764 RepID=A0A1Q5PJA6_9ACTO|nr:hypothetical protein [Boudabousia liubingyangii]OKL45970.1 hypothetical protein BSR29_08285 [Boudabousia liubingyangii]OKL47754.1 hypothetical protein BSR28_04545 [Boudabousia liubingyangii]